MKNFAIYSDKNNLRKTVEEMEELATDSLAREQRRNECLKIAESHISADIAYKNLFENILKIQK